MIFFEFFVGKSFEGHEVDGFMARGILGCEGVADSHGGDEGFARGGGSADELGFMV